jgi:hypothetical protein
MTGAGTANGQPYKQDTAPRSYSAGANGTSALHKGYSSGSKHKSQSANQAHTPSTFTAHKGEGNFPGVKAKRGY